MAGGRVDAVHLEPACGERQGQAAGADPELEHRAAARARATSAASRVGAGGHVGDVAVPVVVDVGEAVAVGARVVALHRPSVAGRRRRHAAGPVELGRGLGRSRRQPPPAAPPPTPAARRGAARAEPRRPGLRRLGADDGVRHPRRRLRDPASARPATSSAFTAVFVDPGPGPRRLAATWRRRASSFDDVLAQSATRRSRSATPAPATRWAPVRAPVRRRSLALVFVAAGLARLVSALARRPATSPSASSSGARCRAAWPLLAACVARARWPRASASSLCVLPALAVMTWFLVTAPVIGAEGLGPIEAMRRSARLVSRRFWSVLGLALLRRSCELCSATPSGSCPPARRCVLGHRRASGWVLAGRRRRRSPR